MYLDSLFASVGGQGVSLASKLFNDFILLIFVILFALAWLTLEKKKIFVMSMFLAVILAFAFQSFYSQDRPCVISKSKVECPDTKGFPSIHATVFAVFIVASLGTEIFYLFFVLGIFTFFSRVYLEVHSLEQVMGGIALGIACYFLIVMLLKHFEKNSLVKKYKLAS